MRDLLEEVAARDGSRILLAAETGSRAQGLADERSDHDVRCVVVRPAERYLSMSPPPDSLRVMRPPVDVHLVDVRWFASGLVRSNPAAWAVLASVERILADEDFVERAAEAGELRFSPTTMSHHLRSVARRAMAEACAVKGVCSPLAHALRCATMADMVQETGVYPREMEVRARMEAHRDDVSWLRERRRERLVDQDPGRTMRILEDLSRMLPVTKRLAPTDEPTVEADALIADAVLGRITPPARASRP